MNPTNAAGTVNPPIASRFHTAHYLLAARHRSAFILWHQFTKRLRFTLTSKKFGPSFATSALSISVLSQVWSLMSVWKQGRGSSPLPTVWWSGN